MWKKNLKFLCLILEIVRYTHVTLMRSTLLNNKTFALSQCISVFISIS